MKLKNKTILVTGGTGSFGHKFILNVLVHHSPKKIIVFSRDEYKQYLMKGEFEKFSDKIRFFIGDVRDRDRLCRAFDGVDIVIHAAALKQVPAMEYNPIEAIKTNIMGAMNVIDAAIDKKVKKIIALSTDKAVNPVNLYGGTKLVSDKLFISANAYAGAKDISFSVVRYGNVAGSRGSIIPLLMNLKNNGDNKYPITDPGMTRFWLKLEEAVDIVIESIEKSNGGEIFVAKCPSFKIVDLIKAISPKSKLNQIGIRPGEKMHEVMVTTEDSRNTYEYKKYYIIYPMRGMIDFKTKIIKGGKKVPANFYYSSDSNKHWLDVEKMKQLVTKL